MTMAHTQESICCPQCSSTKIWKDGMRYTNLGTIQRYLCRNCGYRFSDSHSKQAFSSSDISKHAQKVHTKPLKSKPAIRSPRRVSGESQGRGASALLTGGRCLAKVETRKQERAAGATKTDRATIKGKIIEFAWWMKKEGYAETTIITRSKLLTILAKRGADLNDPESVKKVIAEQNWCAKRKINAADAYSAFLRMMGKQWNPPRYTYAQKLPFIPTEEEIDALIAGTGPKTSTFLQLLKETGARAGEANALQWTDIDFEKGTVRITAEKGSNPRIFKISNKLLSMLRALQAKSKSTKIFSKHLRTQRRLFQKQRRTLAIKLQNPRLLQIHFHTFRHWKATMEYAKTKDILHVMKILGHKNIKNTLIYTQLIPFKDDEYTSKVATNAKEACQLIEAGFEYVCTTPENLMIFRKRK